MAKQWHRAEINAASRRYWQKPTNYITPPILVAHNELISLTNISTNHEMKIILKSADRDNKTYENQVEFNGTLTEAIRRFTGKRIGGATSRQVYSVLKSRR